MNLYNKLLYLISYIKISTFRISRLLRSPSAHWGTAWQKLLFLSSQEKPEVMNCSGTTREDTHQTKFKEINNQVAEEKGMPLTFRKYLIKVDFRKSSLCFA